MTTTLTMTMTMTYCVGQLIEHSQACQGAPEGNLSMPLRQTQVRELCIRFLSCAATNGNKALG